MSKFMLNNHKSELLLPVGNMNMLLAAIHNGADAIYVGMPHFNARGRTTDFSVTELKEMIETAHLYGVRVNLAFNVVIFQDELHDVISLLKEVLPLAPDALIVQDIGLVKLVREMAPNQVVHGSTQMTVTNHEAMSLLDDLKIKRFVLGREVSLPEMRAIKEKTDRELEVFVHGALCVAYSGQCFTSESIGGRSANRGQCAQSCRLEYEMIVDGKKRDLADLKYLVSPKDLCGIAEIPELVNIGIESFKVEGRLKTPEYVAAAAKNYRAAIDQAEDKKQLSKKEIESAKVEMGLTYSRGFFSGWLHGVDHQELVDGTFGAHRGVEIGKVLKVENKSVLVEINYPQLKNGDGILIAGSVRGKKTEIGGMLYGVKKISNTTYDLTFGKEVDLKKIQVGLTVYFNHDAVVEKKLTQSYTDKNSKKRIPLEVVIDSRVGETLKVSVTDGVNSILVESAEVLEAAKDRPTTRGDLAEELGALGATCFILSDISMNSNAPFFIHQKSLKKIRRDFTEILMQKRVAPKNVILNEISLPQISQSDVELTPKLNVMLREISQVKDFLDFYAQLGDTLGVVYLDYEFGKGYAESVAMLKEKGMKVGIATTRILKPNEYYNFKIIERAKPDIILCRNLGAVQYFQDKDFELRGDFSLNVTNSVTADYFSHKKLSKLCASYDLNATQLFDLVDQSKKGLIEVTAHQYMPSFHMEHCVFAAFMSEGSSFKDCGKPCEEHRLELKDQFGNHHQIKADQECRNTMFNATPQSAAKLIPQLLNHGVSEFRFEALYERGEELDKKIMGYKKLLDNKSPALTQEIIATIGVLEKYGLSDGSHRSREYQDRKKV
jgi:putative protease